MLFIVIIHKFEDINGDHLEKLKRNDICNITTYSNAAFELIAAKKRCANAMQESKTNYQQVLENFAENFKVIQEPLETVREYLQSSYITVKKVITCVNYVSYNL